MINELYELSKVLQNENITTQRWHRKYQPIPNIRNNAPCVCIKVSAGKVNGISSVDAELGKILRKYGSNQGSYPCMNLAPLYRITDDAKKKKIADLCDHPEKIDDACIADMETWCTEDINNWSKKFQRKYKISMKDTPEKLCSIATQYEPLKILLDETNFFADASDLHKELARTAWDLLEQKDQTSLALSVLFYQGKKDKSAEDDYGSLSVAFDSVKLIENGTPAVSESFVCELNECLLYHKKKDKSAEDDSSSLSVAFDSVKPIKNELPAVSESFVCKLNKCLLTEDTDQHAESIVNLNDAFGIPFQAIEEPMPNVKLAGGFDVTLRTMFKEQRCQTRYGKIGNASYPISPKIRMDLQAALEWAGSSEQKDTTWINTDKNEVLFAYPSSLPKQPVSFTAFFKQNCDKSIEFSSQAKQFIQELRQTKEIGTDSNAKRITIFVLRKIDKARTKVVYTRQTDPYELEKCSEEWTFGCANLPPFPFETPKTLYPLDIADVLNRFWKQSGEVATDKFKPVPRYHGIEILMDSKLSVSADLHRLSESAMSIGSFFGNLSAKNAWSQPMQEKAKDMLALMGLLFYRERIGKEKYMESLPYLYGQLLKAADELHVLYCKVVRNGEVPPQLVGGTLFQSAAEAPIRTLNILSQRIMPYYSWAKSYRLKGIMEADKESWRAGWLYRICEQTVDKLQNSWAPQTRFSDEEKAQLFIGYLAAFPKKEQSEKNSEEDSTNE